MVAFTLSTRRSGGSTLSSADEVCMLLTFDGCFYVREQVAGVGRVYRCPDYLVS